MRRRLFTFAAAVSLALSAGTVALWLESYAHPMYCQFWTTHGLTEIISIRGVLKIDNDPQWRLEIEPYWAAERRVQDQIRKLRTESFSFEQHIEHTAAIKMAMDELSSASHTAIHWSQASSTRSFSVSIRWGVVMTSTAVLPIFWLVRCSRLKTNRSQHLRVSCSYDLTANTSGICPECGTPVADKAGAKA